MRGIDIDRKIIKDIMYTHKTFGEMLRILRDLWVHDMGAYFYENMLPNETEISSIIVGTGVWEENKYLIAILEKNEWWWNRHFVGRLENGGYEFSI